MFTEKYKEGGRMTHWTGHCSTLKLGNVCLGVLLLLLLFSMDLCSVLNYTLNSRHPERVKVTLLQWPTRHREEKPGFSCRPLPTCTWQGRNICCLGVTKGETTFDAKLHLPDWNKLWRYLSLLTLGRCCFLQYIFFLRCAAKPRAVWGLAGNSISVVEASSQTPCLPWHWRTNSSCPQGLFPWDLTEGQKAHGLLPIQHFVQES